MKTAHLFVPFYTPASSERFAELQYALTKNLKHEWLAHIILLIDDDTFLKSPPPSKKISIRRLDRRPTYADWIHYSAELEDPASLSICANADIELGDDFCLKASQEIVSDKTLLCITRYDLNNDGERVLRNNPHWTQDTWVMALAGVKEAAQSLGKQLDIPFGTPRCDNKVPYVFWLRNWKLVNPCERVRTLHHQQSANRDYSKRDESILGGVAYVYPSLDCGAASPIDIDIYSLSSQPPSSIKQNMFLIKAESSGGDNAVSLSIADCGNRQPRKCSLHDRSVILFVHQMLKDWTIVHRYTERFLICKKSDRIAFVDLKWPTAATYRDPCIDKFNDEALLEAFLWGFCFPVTEFLSDQFSPNKLFSNQNNFWQYPCRTEQDAYERHLRIPSPCLDNGVAHTYVGLPWATWIDKKMFPSQLIKAFGDRLENVSRILADKGIVLRVHSVCQHIHWKRHIDSFLQAGITDLWISHKEKGWDTVSGLRLHAWSLYAVNVLDPGRREGLEVMPVEKKPIFASFKGAYMKHYLSDIRLRLKEFSRLEGYKIDVSNLWHFNRVVYDYQVNGQEDHKKSVEQQEIVTYNQLLSQSLFSLCPVGAGPNTLRLWESLGIGSIPVILSDKYENPRIANGCTPDLWKDSVIIHKESEIQLLDSYLKGIDNSELKVRQHNCLKLFKLFRSTQCFYCA